MEKETDTLLKPEQILQNFAAGQGITVDQCSADFCRLKCEIEPRHFNIHGIAHGGMIFTLLDASAGIAVREAAAAGGEHRAVVTQCAGVHFLRPVSAGTVVAEGRIIRSGRSTAVVRAELFNPDGKLAAFADFEMFYVK